MADETFNLPTPPDFQGLDPDMPITAYDRHLPHWRQTGATYFVTFRQADSLPQSKLNVLKALRREWEAAHPKPRSSAALHELAKTLFEKMEHWLDDGHGSCLLGRPEVAREVVAALHHFDNNRYVLGACVVMPNHVHVIVRPSSPEDDSLEDILRSWKGFTARRINRLVGRSGTFWQQESFDRLIRDEEHLYRCLQYIGRNPLKIRGSIPIAPWMRKEWAEAGWRFEGDIEEWIAAMSGRTDLEVHPTGVEGRA